MSNIIICRSYCNLVAGHIGWFSGPDSACETRQKRFKLSIWTLVKKKSWFSKQSHFLLHLLCLFPLCYCTIHVTTCLCVCRGRRKCTYFCTGSFIRSVSKKSRSRKSWTSSSFSGPPMFNMRIPVLGFLRTPQSFNNLHQTTTTEAQLIAQVSC